MDAQPPRNASVSETEGGVRGRRLALCVWPQRMETNKESFESAGEVFMSKTKKTKESGWLRNRRKTTYNSV